MPSTSAPDFAFPKKLEANAMAEMRKAIKEKNGANLVNSAIKWGLAKAEVSADSIPGVLDKLRVLASDDVVLPEAQAMLQILQAKIYTDIYSADSYTYRERTSIEGASTSGDYKLWNRDQFFNKVRELTAQALKNRERLLDTPIVEYNSSIEIDRESTIFFPTLYDFIASRAISYLGVFDNASAVLSTQLAETPLDENLYPSNKNNPTGDILRIYRSLVEGRENRPSGVIELHRMLAYITDRLFRPNTQHYIPSFLSKPDNFEYDIFMSAYQRCKESPYAIELIVNLEPEGAEKRKEFYALLKTFESEHPDYFNINAVKNQLAEIARGRVSASYPTQYPKDRVMKVCVRLENVNTTQLNIYHLPDNNTDQWQRKPDSAPIATYNCAVKGEIPFKADTYVDVTLPEYGQYIIVPEFDGAEISRGGSYNVLSCSDLASGAYVHAAGATATVSDAWRGTPMQRAIFSFNPWSRKVASQAISGATDAEGVLNFVVPGNGEIHTALGDDRFAKPFNIYPFGHVDNALRYRAEVNTSLGLYRLGETVDYAVIATKSKGDEDSQLAENLGIKVELLDANYQTVETQSLTTDQWGRAVSSIKLPTTGLTGQFAIRVFKDKSQIGSANFTVSDYKLPTFKVVMDSVARPSRPGEPAIIYGTAQTFAGFPVGESKVTAQVKVRSGFWYWSATSPVFYEASSDTDAGGKFRIEIPGEAIAASPAPRGYFVVDVSVASPDGETQQAQTAFNMGKPLNIVIYVPSIFEIGKSNARVDVRNYNNVDAHTPLKYVIYNLTENGSTLRFSREYDDYSEDESYVIAKKGELNSADLNSLLCSLDQGRYLIEIEPTDTSLADKAYSGEFVVYDPDSNNAPIDALLWIPATSVSADSSGIASVKFATSIASANVFMIVSDSQGNVVTKKWLNDVTGQHVEKFRLPDVDEQYRMYLQVVSNAQSASAAITILPAASAKALKISFETFRDKVVPLAQETIKLKVQGLNGARCQSAVMLDMSNRAIDVLAPNTMDFSARMKYFRGLSLDGWAFSNAQASASQPVNYLTTIDIDEPQLNLYGRNFMGFGRTIYLRGSRMMKMAAVNTDYAGAEDEMVVELASAPMADMATDAGGTFDATTAEKAEEEGAAKQSENTETYRPSEIPLAFFKPLLTTSEDGALTVTYTVPNANTTWVLRALAYNRELLSAKAQQDILASKPIMVSANAPRFLRSGDNVVLQASVMNATDSDVVATTTFELLDCANMQPVASVATTDSIAAMGRCVVKLPFEVSKPYTGLVLRVKSTAADFTDGEQSILPILASTQDITESQMFYLAPNQQHYSLEINSVGVNGRAYLDFTENPTWQVVSALPGLRQGAIDSSIDAASALFSVSVAEGLMRKYPEIKMALRRWKENPSDSTLVSELEKNENLKSILLNDSPWVGEALSQTQRMQRLLLLFDSEYVAQARNSAIAQLKKCHIGGEGWCWTTNYPETSQWATEHILDMLGGIRLAGFLDDDKELNGMIESAVLWLDACAVKLYNKYPKSDFTLYAYTRVKFADIIPSTAAKRVVNATVRKILSDWRNHSVVLKAADAIILNGNGYNATARQILASLVELSTSTPERGMWWQQLEQQWFFSMDKVGCTSIILDAFAHVEPKNAAIDKIRQWLVLEKVNTDWGNQIITSQVVQSILTSGSEWTIKPALTVIRINNHLIENNNTESYTGSFVEQISDMVVNGGKLTIDRQANYPSFGSVVTMRRLPMEDVKAQSCLNLCVDKSLSVMRNGQWVAANTFQVGDRVKVLLTLRVDDDIDFVVVQDQRAATFEPVEQLPTPVWVEGLCFYRENRNAQTNLFIDSLPRGVYVLEYELFATQAGTFASGVTEVQSLYNPAIVAHSSGCSVNVEM